jgi:putative addiction module killer protein
MEVLPTRVEVYELPNGSSPFQIWLDSLADIKTRLIVRKRLARLRAGNFGDCKFFESIAELRIDYGPGYRIYIGKKGDSLVILLAGGTKKSQAGDIQKAKQYWQDLQTSASCQRPL